MWSNSENGILGASLWGSTGVPTEEAKSVNFNTLTNDLDEIVNGRIINFEQYTHESNGYINKTTGSIYIDNNLHCKYTDKIPCKQGECFNFIGKSNASAASVIYFKDNTILDYVQNDSLNILKIIIPENCNFVLFSSYAGLNQDIPFDIEYIGQYYNLKTVKSKIDFFNDELEKNKYENYFNDSMFSPLNIVDLAYQRNIYTKLIKYNNIIIGPRNYSTLGGVLQDGSSYLIGSIQDFINKYICIHFNNKYEYNRFAINIGKNWSSDKIDDNVVAGYRDIYPKKSYYTMDIINNYLYIDFDSFLSYMIQTYPYLIHNNDTNVYLMIYESTIPDDNKEYTNYYQLATLDKPVDNDNLLNFFNNKSQYIERVDYDNIGIKYFDIDIASIRKEFQITSDNNIITLSYDSTMLANDAGISLLIGKVTDFINKNIYIKIDTETPEFIFKNILINLLPWGVQGAVDIKQYLLEIQNGIYSINLTEAIYESINKNIVKEKISSDYNINDLDLYFINYNNTFELNGTTVTISYSFFEQDNSKIIAANITEDSAKIMQLQQKILTLETYINNGSGNVLYGKKYVACGDSFTQGDFTSFVDENGLSGHNSPVLHDSVTGYYKTYPYWIANRNNMILVNEALCGSIMALDKDYVNGVEGVPISTRSPFTYQRLYNIPEDADYITIWFGINDTAHTNLGTIDDSTNETFYGAYNVALDWLITNRPYAKIGIIVTNGAGVTYRQAERDVAKKWGIPYLDMMGDIKVPVLLQGREADLGLSNTAKTKRHNSFVVSPTNGHPGIEAHKYQSTFIENFLRSL